MYVICVIVHDWKEKKLTVPSLQRKKAPANCEVPCWSIFVLAGFLLFTVAIIICLGVIIKKRPGDNKVSPDEEEVQNADLNLVHIPKKESHNDVLKI